MTAWAVWTRIRLRPCPYACMHVELVDRLHAEHYERHRGRSCRLYNGFTYCTVPHVLPSAGCSTGTAKKTESRRSSLADEHARRTESDEKSEIWWERSDGEVCRSIASFLTERLIWLTTSFQTKLSSTSLPINFDGTTLLLVWAMIIIRWLVIRYHSILVKRSEELVDGVRDHRTPHEVPYLLKLEPDRTHGQGRHPHLPKTTTALKSCVDGTDR